jgi:hypothetical protein
VVAVPVPLTPLPIGVQIIAAPWREDVALRIAYALEQAGIAAAPRPAWSGASSFGEPGPTPDQVRAGPAPEDAPEGGSAWRSTCRTSSPR